MMKLLARQAGGTGGAVEAVRPLSPCRLTPAIEREAMATASQLRVLCFSAFAM